MIPPAPLNQIGGGRVSPGPPATTAVVMAVDAIGGGHPVSPADGVVRWSGRPGAVIRPVKASSIGTESDSEEDREGAFSTSFPRIRLPPLHRLLGARTSTCRPRRSASLASAVATSQRSGPSRFAGSLRR